jgi:hypothetical protein
VFISLVHTEQPASFTEEVIGCVLMADDTYLAVQEFLMSKSELSKGQNIGRVSFLGFLL